MNATANAADKQWFGHPRGLSTLFFTELWERLSYYGMRAILVLFMVDQIETGGFGMSDGKAAAIYGLYTAGVYLLALPGGWIADRILGQQKAVFWGGCVIAAGHFTMALPLIPGTEALSKPSFYFGLVLIVIGTGLLKPNVSAIVGDLYPEKGARRDAGFSLFYMGINFGALAGPIICGFLGEKIDWHLGFSAAGFGMLLGLIQYRWGLKYLGDAGTLQGTTPSLMAKAKINLYGGLAAVAATLAVLVIFSAQLGLDLERVAGLLVYVIAGLGVLYFAYVLLFTDLTTREKKRVFVIFLLFVGAALFWSGFEQAGSSMNLFAERHTDRGGPLISLVLGLPSLALLFFIYRKMESADSLAAVLAFELATVTAWFAYQSFGLLLSAAAFAAVGSVVFAVSRKLPVAALKAGLYGLLVAAAGWLVYWSTGPGANYLTPASWLQSVNPLFIVVMAPVFGWLWVALGRLEPSIPFKFGTGLILLGGGFLVLAFGSTLLDQNPDGVTPWWLIITYFLHTAGELCLSPVGLSSVTKLSPHRLVGQMMGTWFMGAALGNIIAGLVAGRIESLPLPQLFGTVALIVIVSGTVFLVLTIPIKKLIGDLDAEDEHPTQVPTDALDEAPKEV